MKLQQNGAERREKLVIPVTVITLARLLALVSASAGFGRVLSFLAHEKAQGLRNRDSVTLWTGARGKLCNFDLNYFYVLRGHNGHNIGQKIQLKTRFLEKYLLSLFLTFVLL